MSRLYIIGNGFDIAHGIPSRYTDFRNYCQTNIPEMFEKLNRYYRDHVDDLWSSFEDNMPNINQEAIFDWATINNQDWNQSWKGYNAFIDEIRHEVDYVDSIKSDITKWFQSIELTNVHKLYCLSLENSLFITFNYTLTLEQIYHINSNQICHIHGSVQGNFPYLVLGHNMQDQEINTIFSSVNEFEQEACSEVVNLIRGWRKDTQAVIAANEGFFDNLTEITDVFVLGHSMSDVDLPYFTRVKQIVNENVTWYISFYGTNDENRKKNVAEELKLPNFELIQLDDLRREKEGLLF